MDYYKSPLDFFKDNDGIVFRYWVYRRMFTPFEQEKAYSDESFFEDTHANFGIVRDCIALGNGEYLLGFQDVYDLENEEGREYTVLNYYRLSEIRLSYYHADQIKEYEEEE